MKKLIKKYTAMIRKNKLVPALTKLTVDRNRLFYKNLVMCYKPCDWANRMRSLKRIHELTPCEIERIDIFVKEWDKLVSE